MLSLYHTISDFNQACEILIKAPINLSYIGGKLEHKGNIYAQEYIWAKRLQV